MNSRLLPVLVAAMLMTFAETASAESPNDILIVVNNAVPQSDITIGELKNLFLKEKTNWSSGKKALPVHAPAGSSLRKDFVSRVLGMNPSGEKIYWQERKIKTGKVQPVEFSNTLKAVFKLRGSVSYVYRSQYKKGVAKVVLVLPAQ
ncbi:MAG: hypothetical protein GY854_12315 [Deltaproteobacteria bacterium]|nr:hypothetical protein [Deltaproteobacteria bacterium]